MKNIPKSQLKLISSVCIVGLIEIFIGCSTVFSAVLLAQLHEPSSSLKLNANEASWIASISLLICPLGLLIIGTLADKIGRRRALHVTYLTIFLSWSIFAFCNSFEAILVGKILQGFTFGANTVTYMYVGEICNPHQRPLFVSLVTLMVGVGMTLECLLAVFFHWHTVAGMLLVASVVGCTGLFIVPESPAWLRTRGSVREAEAAEKWFGVTPPAPRVEHVSAADDLPVVNVKQNELVAVTSAGTTGADVSATTDITTAAANSGWSAYVHRTVWLPMLTMLGFFLCQEVSGFYVLISYSSYVLQDFRIRWDGITVTAMLCTARVVGSLVFSALYGVRRRTLTVVSGTGMAISLVVTMASRRVFATGESVNAVPVTAFVAYIFFAMLGLMPLPWIYSSELFPTAIKGTMNGVILTCQSLMTFCIIKMYPTAVLHLGVEVVWTVFSIFCVFGACYGVFVLPETKGKSLDEILMMFESREKKKTIDTNNA